MNIRFWQNSILSWKIAYSGFIDCRFPFERWGGDSRFPANARGATFSGNAVSPSSRKESRIVWPVRCAASRPAGSSRFFKEVGQRPDFQPCLEHDFIGANARARRIDERCAKEFPVRAVKRPAIRIATAVLMYSFGGLRREGGGESEMLPPGISEPELLAICVSPYLDSTPVLACLKEWFGPFRKRIFIVRNRR